MQLNGNSIFLRSTNLSLSPLTTFSCLQKSQIKRIPITVECTEDGEWHFYTHHLLAGLGSSPFREMIEWRQTFPKLKQEEKKKPQIIENIIPWLFFPSRKPHSKTLIRKKEIKTCTDSYSVMPSIIFGLSPRSSFPSLSPIETDTNHKEEPRRSTATLFSSLFFPWLVRTRKKKVCCSNPHCVHTDIYVLYIYFRCTTAAAATDKRRRRKKGRHSIAQLLSDSNRRNRNPTDRPNPRWKRRKKKGRGKDDDDGHQ